MRTAATIKKQATYDAWIATVLKNGNEIKKMKKVFIITTILLVGLSGFSQEIDPIYVYEFNKKTDTILDKETPNSKGEGLLIEVNEKRLYFHITPVDSKLQLNILRGVELEDIIERGYQRRKDFGIYIFMNRKIDFIMLKISSHTRIK